jgi:hypothetical protein
MKIAAFELEKHLNNNYLCSLMQDRHTFIVINSIVFLYCSVDFHIPQTGK